MSSAVRMWKSVTLPSASSAASRASCAATAVMVAGAASVAAELDGVLGPTAGMAVVADGFGAFEYNRTAEERDLVVIHQDGSLVTPDNPARPGETLTLFGTGIGSLTNRPATGEAAGANPLSQCVAYPEAAVSGLGGGELAVGVGFCGLTPGFAGLVQLNLTMPSEPMAGAEATLVLAFEGRLLSYRLATE